jgi:hypothetical protein
MDHRPPAKDRAQSRQSRRAQSRLHAAAQSLTGRFGILLLPWWGYLTARSPPPPKAIELHPASITRYLASVNALSEVLARRLVVGDNEAAGALRELVAAVIVRPKKGEPEIQITGHLALLTGAELFPSTLVAGAGIEPATYGL